MHENSIHFHLEIFQKKISQGDKRVTKLWNVTFYAYHLLKPFCEFFS
ncbi:hypothetical protein LptCag_1447 [Leptospirillum ferriphilum]|uniref:Uncharacterized protein n=1 Tax=Leptospirillum ferriphilum TaxID=178606 RepID=A0A094WDL1_9BACT|nr:hypothetical protein LptCag_1447 [Leptospirillum ferriphilum]